MTREQRERLRRRYRPEEVRLLFIGEAPPASGRFFYNRDSGLYRAMRDAFRSLDPAIADERFLAFFQSAGCYLIDACAQPVDDMDRASRRAACLESEPALARRIRRLRPRSIVILLKSIRVNVQRAALQAGWRGRFLELPYPGRWVRHRAAFLDALTPELKMVLQDEGQGTL